jgi:hypothetical protein
MRKGKSKEETADMLLGEWMGKSKDETADMLLGEWMGISRIVFTSP